MNRCLPVFVLGFVLSAVAGCKSIGEPKRDFTLTVARFFLETNDRSSASVELPVSGVRVSIGAKPVITEGDIVAVDLVQVDLGKCLLFHLTPSAARDLYRMSGANQGRRLVLLLNHVAIGARRIEAPLSEGRIFMFAEVAEADLPALATNLQKSTAELQAVIAKKK
jgi:hypothetical protein